MRHWHSRQESCRVTGRIELDRSFHVGAREVARQGPQHAHERALRVAVEQPDGGLAAGLVEQKSNLENRNGRGGEKLRGGCELMMLMRRGAGEEREEELREGWSKSRMEELEELLRRRRSSTLGEAKYTLRKMRKRRTIEEEEDDRGGGGGGAGCANLELSRDTQISRTLPANLALSRQISHLSRLVSLLIPVSDSTSATVSACASVSDHIVGSRISSRVGSVGSCL